LILKFNTNGNEKQKECARAWLNPDISDIVYGGSKGSGKSYLGCSLIFGDAFIYPGTHYFIARKQLNDLRKFTIPSIHEVFKHWGVTENYYKFNGQDNYFTLYNDSKVYLIDAKYLPSDPLFSRYGSMQITRGWVEEGGEFEAAAKNNLSASVGRWRNDEYNLSPKLLQTCNPAKNYLYGYYKRYRDNELNTWEKFIQALPTDNKKLPDGYLQHLERTLSPVEKERLLFGNWEYDDDPSALINYDSILNSFTNEFVIPGKAFISADVARYGSDRIVIIVWSGLRAEKIITRQKQSITDTAALIESLAKEKRVPRSNIIIDDDGVGGGVTDILKGAKGFINNSKALHNENYSNLKSQCYFKLSDKINNNEIFINCTDSKDKELITQELEYVKQAKIDSEGKKQIMAKEKVKELIGRSPDFADALMMRMYFELSPAIDLNSVLFSNPRQAIMKDLM
jgi:hypothetical protein